jgi:hypothetical protein
VTLIGLSGSLLSGEALAQPVPDALAGLLDESGREAARRRLRAWHLPLRSVLGPTTGARKVFDLVALPLLTHLGFHAVVMNRANAPPHALLRTARSGHSVGVLIVTAWGEDPGGAWRDAIRHGIGHDVRWCFCVNGPAIRLFDAARTYSRRFAEFDIACSLDDEITFASFWGLLRGCALDPSAGKALLDRAVEICERHRTGVRESLKEGVREAIVELADAFLAKAGGRQRDAQAVDESLIVIYRVLFLLFAEARGLVPKWHPVYRDSYTIESLRQRVELRREARGLWESLQAIARLAHRGCRAGTLRVAPFNGRLFSPSDAPLADSLQLDDEPVRRALLALTTRPGKDGRTRIAYADLGVEQLGAVYEHVLDFTPRPAPAVTARRRPPGRRKATGSFYTPRSLTEYLVRRTLAPLVEGVTPAAILALRIVDPSMGSGAFLVAACRYLGHAYEHAVVREGGLAASDIGPADRTAFRRAVAQRCLFGVDINPMAVQLARLSLWLATLAGDRPLTFLDHHLRTGDSLVGASLVDLHRQPPAGPAGVRSALPLLPMDDFESGLRAIVPPRLALAEGADDTLEQVRHKEETLGVLTGEDGPLARWKAAADLWCAAWFQPRRPGDVRLYGALLDRILEGSKMLPGHVAAPRLETLRATARARRFFHWTLEFPEVFYGEDGAPLSHHGFDAVIGNPPWDMLRADRDGDGGSSDLTRFARGSGIYRLQCGGHANLYQLFVERALSLLKPGGRFGFIVPSGLATDHGCSALRRELLGRTTIDTFLTVENRDAIFPIHRGLKFTLFTLTKAGATAALPTRVGVRSADTLDRLPDMGSDHDAVLVPESLLRQLTGAHLVVPEIRSALDLDLVARIVQTSPALGDADGWGLRFGRELNASDDRRHFTDGGRGLPVVEGKHLQPFSVDTKAARARIAPETAVRLLGARSSFRSARLAYRDVASATNRLTLIAAIVPAGVVTTHTIFCVKQPPDPEVQHFLCGIFNSFVANHLVRMRVTTHVTAALIERLPVPRPQRDHEAFRRLSELSTQLAAGHLQAAPEQQALAAALYGLTDVQFAHVLEGFPLVPRADREAALSAFRCIVPHRL